MRSRAFSLLVLADARPPRDEVSEADLGRTRVLAGAADSVFAVGRDHNKRHYIVQMRSATAPVFWTRENAPGGEIVMWPTGQLVIEFDERFAPDIDAELAETIRKVKQRHDEGATYREIAEELGLSRSQAQRYYKKWTPALAAGDGNGKGTVEN